MYQNNLKEIPLISIAMATYNGEKYLKEQLDSIYAQTYKNIEVIVTDDCSMDGTVEILKQYANSHGLKYYVNEQNLGFVKNFEKAVSLCTGEFIALSDQDDIWLPHKLTTLVQNIGDKILACSDAKLIDENNHVIAESFFKYRRKSQNEKLTFLKLMLNNSVTGCTVLMKRNILGKAHPLPLDIDYHDWWYGVIASTLDGVYMHPEALILYRQHEANHTGVKEKESISIFQKIYLLANKKYFKKRMIEGEKRVKRLEIYRHTNRFSHFENNILEDLIEYYKSYGNGFFHFKAFFIALKYRNNIYHHLPKKLRSLACLRSLFL